MTVEDVLNIAAFILLAVPCGVLLWMFVGFVAYKIWGEIMYWRGDAKL